MLLTVSYAIDTLTAMSVSAISTNGQVRGGGEPIASSVNLAESGFPPPPPSSHIAIPRSVFPRDEKAPTTLFRALLAQNSADLSESSFTQDKL